MTIIKNAKLVLENEILENKFLTIEDEKIKSVENECPSGDFEIIDAEGYYVSPGFIDIHTHGAAGFNFSESEEAGIAIAADFHLSHGTTSIVPTISASSKDVTMEALKKIKSCMEKKLAKGNILGAQLEGPYFEKEMCGAQNVDFITPPIKEDYTEFVEKYGDIIRIWSYAPEHDKGGEFCKYICENGIIPSAGHSAAIYSDMKTAMENGLRNVTHLYSCTSTITRELGFRRLGIIETAFLHDEITVEIIADGKHLPPDLIKMIYKIKGCDNIIMVTDSLMAAGSSEMSGCMGGISYIIEDGVCKVPDRSCFAGSIATTDRLVRVCIKEAGIPLVCAIKMMTKNPARMLRLNKGEIKSGFDADLVFFDEDINIKKVIVSGKVVK